LLNLAFAEVVEEFNILFPMKNWRETLSSRGIIIYEVDHVALAAVVSYLLFPKKLDNFDIIYLIKEGDNLSFA